MIQTGIRFAAVSGALMIESQTNTDGTLHSIGASGDGYKITVEGDKPPVIEVDHAKAKMTRLPSSGEVERFVIEER